MNRPSVENVLACLRPLRSGAKQKLAGAPWVEGRFSAEQLELAIADIGPLSLPASALEIAALRLIAKPAPFGLGAKTLVDVAVRDTGEIDAEALMLRWGAGTQADLCAQIAQGLGLPQVELQPHKLLSYGVGQFFKPHQDTTRRPRMVATLVLIWPSAHLGGELRIQHDGRSHSFRSQQLGADGQIRWCAFYADCRHEVLPVEEGQRLALSFEVMVPDSASMSHQPADATLAAALAAVFTSNSMQAEIPPEPWLLLLDHLYNEHGLRWRTLKSRDRATAMAVRAAAEAQGLTVHLVLIEQTEVRHSDGDSQDYDDCDDISNDINDDDDDDNYDEGVEPELGELIDSDCTTMLWVDLDDQIISRYRMVVDQGELSSFRRTSRGHLVNQEYEGYMGNYGETMSYWYRRAALVVQSPAAALRLSYEINCGAALRALAGRAKDSAQSEAVQAELNAVQSILERNLRSAPLPLLPTILELAATLPPALASALLAPLHHAAFRLQDVPALRLLQQHHGAEWLQAMLSIWAANPDTPRWNRDDLAAGAQDGAPPWPEPLNEFFLAIQTQGLHPNIVRDWQAALLKQFMQSQTRWQHLQPAQRHADIAQRQRWIQRLLCTLCIGINTKLENSLTHGPLIRALQSLVSSNNFPLTVRVSMLCCLEATACAALPALLGLRTQLLDSLSATLAVPEFAVDDHSLRDIEWVCRCPICTQLIQWAESSTAAPYRVAIAEAGRQHIQLQLQWAGAPISTQVIKQGRPFVLECLKPSDIANRREQQRAALFHARTKLQAVQLARLGLA